METALDDDVARVAAVRKVLGPQGRIRIDANGAWDLQQAVTSIGELAQYGLEYAEQPCASVDDLAALRRLLHSRDIPVLIAADESIRRAGDPLRVRDAEAADAAEKIDKTERIRDVRLLILL